MSAMPKIVYANGQAGRQVVVQTSFRLNNTTLAAAASRRRHEHQGRERRQLRRRRQDHDRPGRQRLRQGRPGGPHDHRGRHDRRDRHRASRSTQPLSRNHATARFVEGSRAGTSTHDTQGSNLGWWWTQKDGPQTAQAFTYWGWRYLQILPPGAGETPRDSAPSSSTAPRRASRRATFDSDNATLDAVFELMQRSGIYSSEEVFLDTPTREKGQFTGDTVDISYANMIASGDRNASARAIREILYSATHSWKAASGGYCTAAQLPCSYPSIGTPGPRERRLPERRQHARHPRLHADDAGLGVALLRAVAATRRCWPAATRR